MKDDKLVIQRIQEWDGSINNETGVLLRSRIYECFNGLIAKLGKELSNAINNPLIKSDKDRIQLIKTILAKNNIYDER